MLPTNNSFISAMAKEYVGAGALLNCMGTSRWTGFGLKPWMIFDGRGPSCFSRDRKGVPCFVELGPFGFGPTLSVLLKEGPVFFTSAGLF